MNNKVKQLILDQAVENVRDLLEATLEVHFHTGVSDAITEILGDTVDWNSEDTIELAMDLSSRIAVVGLSEDWK